MGRIIALVAVGLSLIVGGCGRGASSDRTAIRSDVSTGVEPSAQSKPPMTTDQVVRVQAADADGRAALAAVAAYRAHPPSADAPQLGDCAGKSGDAAELCVNDQMLFASRDWPKATRAGGMTEARNVAFCLSTGCNDAVQPQPIRGCAWRLAIIASGSPSQESGDSEEATAACDHLTSGDRLLARSQAHLLHRTLPRLREID